MVVWSIKARLVADPCEGGASLDVVALNAVVATAVRMMDNVVDTSKFPLEAQEREAQAKRWIGLGVTGLADALLMVGLRYGSGKLHHKIEGERTVYWTGPSIGFDVGGNAANSFVLVYNLYDSEELFQRFPAGEGAAYFVGGFHVSYLRSGDKVLIPVRLGAGLRLGANVGYMKFSKKQNWLPF